MFLYIIADLKREIRAESSISSRSVYLTALEIFESEKSVMQLHTYGYHNAAALGGNSIHSYQIEELLKLNVTEFILCFDEGLEIEVIKAAIESIRENLFMRDDVRIGVLLDKDNLIMKKGSKCSPSDNGKLAWEELINKHIKYMKG